MNRFEYLETLERLLISLPYSERRDIMYDYEEHFKEGLNEGKTEEEIINSLGAADKVAGQYVTALAIVTPQQSTTENNNGPKGAASKSPKPRQPVKKPGNSIGEIVALTIIMLLFNSIFIGLYIGFWAVLIAFVVTGGAFVIAGFTLLISAIIATPIAFLSVPAILLQYPVLMFIGSIISICVGGLMLISLFYVIKFTSILTVKYVKWTVKLIRGF